MEKIIFEDLPSTKTPINSINLNQLQNNIEYEITKKYIQLGIKENINIDTTYKNIIFDDIKQDGDLFIVNEDGSIKIKSGVENGKLKIHFHSNIGGNGINAVSNINITIYKNGEEFIIMNGGLSTPSDRTLLNTDVITDYSSGDIFFVRTLTNENSVQALASYYRTLLILEKI